MMNWIRTIIDGHPNIIIHGPPSTTIDGLPMTKHASAVEIAITHLKYPARRQVAQEKFTFMKKGINTSNVVLAVSNMS